MTISSNPSIPELVLLDDGEAVLLDAEDLDLLDAGEAVLLDAEDLVLLDAGEPVLLDAEDLVLLDAGEAYYLTRSKRYNLKHCRLPNVILMPKSRMNVEARKWMIVELIRELRADPTLHSESVRPLTMTIFFRSQHPRARSS